MAVWKIVIILIMGGGEQMILRPSVEFKTEKACDISILKTSNRIVTFNANLDVKEVSVYCAETRSL